MKKNEMHVFLSMGDKDRLGWLLSYIWLAFGQRNATLDILLTDGWQNIYHVHTIFFLCFIVEYLPVRQKRRWENTRSDVFILAATSICDQTTPALVSIA